MRHLIHRKKEVLLFHPLQRLIDGVLRQHIGFNAHLAGKAEVVDGGAAEFILGLFQLQQTGGQFIVPIGEAFLRSMEVMTSDLYAVDQV